MEKERPLNPPEASGVETCKVCYDPFDCDDGSDSTLCSVCGAKVHHDCSLPYGKDRICDLCAEKEMVPVMMEVTRIQYTRVPYSIAYDVPFDELISDKMIERSVSSELIDKAPLSEVKFRRI